VTVSIAAVRMGMFKEIFPVILVLRETSFGRTSDQGFILQNLFLAHNILRFTKFKRVAVAGLWLEIKGGR